jgi:hypothetical protein
MNKYYKIGICITLSIFGSLIISCSPKPFIYTKSTLNQQSNINPTIGVLFVPQKIKLFDNNLYLNFTNQPNPEEYYLSYFERLLKAEIQEKTIFNRVVFINDSFKMLNRTLKYNTKKNFIDIKLPKSSLKSLFTEQGINYLIVFDNFNISVYNDYLAKIDKYYNSNKPVVHSKGGFPATITNSSKIAIIDCQSDSVIQYGDFIQTDKCPDLDVSDYYDCTSRFVSRIFKDGPFEYLR